MEELISKKDLLRLTGISYGQLYRWKRKNLIPEEWFIRKSTFTGQETFFPKEKILARIEQIKNLKEDYSLDDLVEILSPEFSSIKLGKDVLLDLNIFTQEVVNLFYDGEKSNDHFNFKEILIIYCLNKYLNQGQISFDEGKMLFSLLQKALLPRNDYNFRVLLVRKFGISFGLVLSTNEEVFWDDGVKVVLNQDFNALAEEVKTIFIERGVVHGK